MLLGEDRGRCEHRHLLPRLHRLEGRAQRDLGLAVSHVADQQPVHRAGALHVTFTSSEARRWSGVSSYRKADSSSRCHAVSGGKANPVASWRRAYRSRSSAAIWRMAARVLSR